MTLYIYIMDNITTSETPPVEKPAEENRINLSDVNITDQNVALNVLVGFLNIAQRRGAYGMDEAAKIWEAVKYFVVQTPPPAPAGGMPSVPEEENVMSPAGSIAIEEIQ